jgi:hypothetical protein
MIVRAQKDRHTISRNGIGYQKDVQIKVCFEFYGHNNKMSVVKSDV